MPRFQRRRAYTKPRRSFRKRGSKGSFAKKRKFASSTRGGKRPRRGVRRSTNGRGKRRGVNRKGNKTRTFQRELLKAEGQKYKLTRNVQCEFQVPNLNAASLEPTAQYMWPRGNLSSEAQTTASAFMAPMYHNDISQIMSTVLGSSWWALQSTEIYQQKLLIAWKARYQVTNLSNTEVNYERLVFRVKQQIPFVGLTTFNNNTGNPFNLAGAYLAAVQELNSGDAIDATNAALHTERNDIQYNPAWNHWYELKSKKRFSLNPGKTITHILNRKQRMFNALEMYPNILTPGGVQATPLFVQLRGDTFIVYKMLSSPADVNDAALPLLATSTRTQPISLLSYQVNYFVLKPNVKPSTQFTAMTSYGITATGIANIALMGNNNIVEVPMANVI